MAASAPGEMPAHQAKLTHGLFNLVVVLKGLNGLVEIAGALALLLIKTGTITAFVAILASQELSENPNDMVAKSLATWAAGFGHTTQVFAAIYLLGHGIVKTGLAILLLMGKDWAYPVAAAFFSIFIGYMIFRLSHLWSWPLAGLVVLDLVTIAVIVREWRLKRSSPPAHQTSWSSPGRSDKS